MRRTIKAGKVAAIVGVTTRTLENWAADPTDDFPKPVRRKGKLYYDEKEVAEYQEGDFEARDKEQARIREMMRFGRRSA